MRPLAPFSSPVQQSDSQNYTYQLGDERILLLNYCGKNLQILTLRRFSKKKPPDHKITLQVKQWVYQPYTNLITFFRIK